VIKQKHLEKANLRITVAMDWESWSLMRWRLCSMLETRQMVTGWQQNVDNLRDIYIYAAEENKENIIYHRGWLGDV